MLTAKRCRVRRAQDRAVAGKHRGGAPATTMTPVRLSNEKWIRPTELIPRAGW
jgi:hypothetical protein